MKGMIRRFLLNILKRSSARQEPGTSGLQLIGALLDIASLLYFAPFALAGLIWLSLTTDFAAVPSTWLLLASLAAVVVLGQTSLDIRLEVRPGVFVVSPGTLESIPFWSAALIAGPSALWIGPAAALIHFYLDLRAGTLSATFRWRRLVSSVANSTLAALLALQLYQALGGRYPFAGIDSPMLAAGAAATFLWFLLPRLLRLPLILGVSRSPELVGSGSMTDAAGMNRFLLLGSLIFGIADPFGLFAAGLYASQGAADYLIFLAAVLLAGWLTHRLSRSALISDRRGRETAVLEGLAQSIITAPLDEDIIPDLLAESLPALFPDCRMEIKLFPDQLLFRHGPDHFQLEESLWRQLPQASGEHRLLMDVQPAVTGRKRLWRGLMLPIPINGDEAAGGICLLALEKPLDLLAYLPSLERLAAQIGAAYSRIQQFDDALEEQAEAYQKEIYAQAYQAEYYAQALALEKVTQEMVTAGRIQESFLPKQMPDIPGWQIAVTLESARDGSGDFYDIIELSNGHLGLLVADVADKGMGAALFMALSRTLIRTYALEYVDDPAKALQAANQRILADTSSDLFVTVFYAILDTGSGLMRYCNAGHNPPLLLRSDDGSQPYPLTRTALPLGIIPDGEWEQGQVQLSSGDVLALYTDGITESQDEDEEFFGEGRLFRILAANASRSAEVIEDKLIAAVRDFTGDHPQYDDITVMILIRE